MRKSKWVHLPQSSGWKWKTIWVATIQLCIELFFFFRHLFQPSIFRGEHVSFKEGFFGTRVKQPQPKAADVTTWPPSSSSPPPGGSLNSICLCCMQISKYVYKLVEYVIDIYIYICRYRTYVYLYKHIFHTCTWFFQTCLSRFFDRHQQSRKKHSPTLNDKMFCFHVFILWMAKNKIWTI